MFGYDPKAELGGALVVPNVLVPGPAGAQQRKASADERYRLIQGGVPDAQRVTSANFDALAFAQQDRSIMKANATSAATASAGAQGGALLPGSSTAVAVPPVPNTASEYVRGAG